MLRFYMYIPWLVGLLPDFRVKGYTLYYLKIYLMWNAGLSHIPDVTLGPCKVTWSSVQAPNLNTDRQTGAAYYVDRSDGIADTPMLLGIDNCKWV